MFWRNSRVLIPYLQKRSIMKNDLTRASGWYRLSVPREEVEIATVLTCGQSFRWKNDGPDPQEWLGVFGHYLWVLKQTDEELLYKVIGCPELSEEEYNKLLQKYFQLSVSLPELYKQWALMDFKFADLTLKDYQGIRLLEQDPIENMFSFICSSNNNISRISQMVEKLCLFYGKPVGELNGKIYYDFPCVENLCGSEVEKKLREESFGYRAAFIANTARKVVESGGRSWVETLRSMKYDEARQALQSLPGIGRKVADCVCLMSLGFHEAIPVDTHIHQLGKKYLPHLANVKSLTEKVYTEISDYFRGLYGEYAGWAQTVLFASTLRHLKFGSSKKITGKKKGRKQANKSSSDDDSDISSAAEVEPPKGKGKSSAKIVKPNQPTQLSSAKANDEVHVTRPANKRRKI